MNARLSAWLRKEIKVPIRKPSAPSPFVRNVSKAFTVLLLSLVCVFFFWRMRLYLEIDGRFARLRKAGLPTSGAELNPWRGVVPNSENGALALTQAFSLLRTFPDSRSNEIVEPRLLKRTNEWSATTRTMVADYVQLNLPALSKGREALTFRQFQFPTDFSYGPDTPVPHLAELKKLALVIALQSCLAAAEGREQSWVDDVCTILTVV